MAKIYVSVDMEGIAGIVLREQLARGEQLYAEARHLLTLEVNAVVEALALADANEIIVKDAHGTGFNFIVADLHPKATYVLGATGVDQRFPGLDGTFDGAFLIGYHAMGGTQHGIRDHTMTATGWQGIELNGRPIGEIEIDSLIFGLFGVPVRLVTGDDRTCAEAMRVLGDIVTYSTKRALGRHAGLLKAPRRVHAELGTVVETALAANRPDPLRLSGPYELKIRFMSTDLADARYYDGETAERLDGLTVAYRDNDLLRLFARAL